MFATYVSLLTLALGATAQLMINTPAAIVQCQPVLLQWSGGSAPYFINVIPAGEVSAAPLERLPQQTGTSYTWTVDLPAGTAISLSITDSTGATNYGSPVTIQQGTSTDCVNSSVAAPTTTAGGVAGSPTAGAPTTAAVPVAGVPLPSGLFGFSKSGFFAYPSASYSASGSASTGDKTYAVIQGSATGELIAGPSAYIYSLQASGAESTANAYASCSVSGSSAVCAYSNTAGATTFTAPFGAITATAAPARKMRFARDI